VSQPPPAPSSLGRKKHAAPPAASPIPSRILRKITVLERIVRSYSTVVEQIRDRMLSAPDASW